MLEEGFGAGEGVIMELETEAVVHDIVDFLTDIDDAEIAEAGDVET